MALAITFIPRVSAQKKELDKVRNSLKTGKELDKAEQTMYRLLADSTGRQNEKLWLMLYDVVRKQYDAGNERLYLKQSYDTAAIFSLTQRMFLGGTRSCWRCCGQIEVSPSARRNAPPLSAESL